MNVTIELFRPNDLDVNKMAEIAELAGQGFERENDSAMQADTESHVAGADFVQLYTERGRIVAFSLYARCLGEKAFEAAGIVVSQSHQAQGIAPTLFTDFIRVYRPEFMTAYTRNPALVKALGAATGRIYPFDTSPDLRDVAGQMSNATQVGDVTYHIGRYGEDGLYGVHDPADRVDQGHAFKDRFTGLQDPSSALVIVASTGVAQ